MEISRLLWWIGLGGLVLFLFVRLGRPVVGVSFEIDKVDRS